tara:strand:+ start:1417 stop:1686 length:270 start_codon:yes stop_codon:yes gene_type:complete
MKLILNKKYAGAYYNRQGDVLIEVTQNDFNKNVWYGTISKKEDEATDAMGNHVEMFNLVDGFQEILRSTKTEVCNALVLWLTSNEIQAN